MNHYKLNCTSWNGQHVRFTVFDPKGANCGEICVLTGDVFNFIRSSWRGDVFWNGLMPEAAVMSAT